LLWFSYAREELAVPRPSSERLPIVLVPGLACSARLYSDQIPALWPFGSVTVGDHTRDQSIAAIARSVLAAAPPRFALLGLSMGGYIAFEIMRQARERVAKLALLDTAATPETPQQTATRQTRIELAKSGRFGETVDLMFPTLVHRDRHGDEHLKRIVRLMGEETGTDAFIRQQHAIMARADSRPSLAAIGCPTLVVVGDADELTPPAAAHEIAVAISGARLIVIPECGHLSTLERPQMVNAALLEWMAW
jgi:pimeloyl-ACP methyl ester carboxylesterase